MRDLFAYFGLLFGFARSLWRIEHQPDNRSTKEMVNEYR